MENTVSSFSTVTTQHPTIPGLWKQIENARDNPDSIYRCNKCGKHVVIHPNYFNNGIKACIGKNGCCMVKDVAINMMAIRGWKFHDIQLKARRHSISFTCDAGHETTIDYEGLRKGSNCSTCYQASRRKKMPKIKLIRPDCFCMGLTQGYRPVICSHYNFKTMCSDSVLEWDYSKNGNVLPETLSPHSKFKAWFKCRTCNSEYDQTLNSRTNQNSGCPYCSGHKVGITNCLATKNPNLASEWSPDNSLSPYDVTPGSNILVKWICLKHDNKPFTFESKIDQRTRGTGCPRCGRMFDCKITKHPRFVAVSQAIHSSKYQYPETYKGNLIPIAIYCPMINEVSGEIHGIFQQAPKLHKRGHGCPKCTKWFAQLEGGHEEFVRVANIVHNNKYQYPERYVKALEKIGIYCPVISTDPTNPVVHGIFRQMPSNHKGGHGCPKCKNERTESKGVKILQSVLNSLGYIIGPNCISEHFFPDLRYIRLLKVDRYLPVENLVIEYDGLQHFRVKTTWYNEEEFAILRIRDLLKDAYCIKNKINLLRIPYKTTPNLELITNAIKICRTGKQLYASYADYRDEMAKLYDLTGIIVAIMTV